MLRTAAQPAVFRGEPCVELAYAIEHADAIGQDGPLHIDPIDP